MTSWTVIGCSPGFPHPRHACSAYLLDHRGHQILFDCGEGTTQALRRCRIDPNSVETVFVSHLHPDHVIGLPLLIQACYILKRRERLDIIAPAESISGLKRLLNLTYLFPHKLGFELEFHPLSRRFEFEMNGLRITPVANQHLRGHAKFLRRARLPNKMECYSFAIQSDSHKINYSADLDSLADLEAVISATDLLVVEGMHIDLSMLGAMSRANGVSQILLTHLPEDFDFRGAKQLIASQSRTKVFEAREGLTIRLKAATAR